MKTIKKILDSIGTISHNDLFQCFETIGSSGDVAIFKIDGGRPSQRYTIVISSPNMSFEAIRYDSSTMEDSLRKALKEYILVKEV